MVSIIDDEDFFSAEEEETTESGSQVKDVSVKDSILEKHNHIEVIPATKVSRRELAKLRARNRNRQKRSVDISKPMLAISPRELSSYDKEIKHSAELRARKPRKQTLSLNRNDRRERARQRARERVRRRSNQGKPSVNLQLPGIKNHATSTQCTERIPVSKFDSRVIEPEVADNYLNSVLDSNALLESKDIVGEDDMLDDLLDDLLLESDNEPDTLDDVLDDIFDANSFETLIERSFVKEDRIALNKLRTVAEKKLWVDTLLLDRKTMAKMTTKLRRSMRDLSKVYTAIPC